MMKHVGMNVALGRFCHGSLYRRWGGMVLVVADDPGMYSSPEQEQDSRMVARAAMVPVVEALRQCCRVKTMKYAYDLSEKYDTPVLLPFTTKELSIPGDW